MMNNVRGSNGFLSIWKVHNTLFYMFCYL